MKHIPSPLYVRYAEKKILARAKQINYACKLCQTSFLLREIELCLVLSTQSLQQAKRHDNYAVP